MFVVQCPKCKHTLRFKREVVNSRIKCRYCGNNFSGSTAPENSPRPVPANPLQPKSRPPQQPESRASRQPPDDVFEGQPLDLGESGKRKKRSDKEKDKKRRFQQMRAAQRKTNRTIILTCVILCVVLVIGITIFVLTRKLEPKPEPKAKKSSAESLPAVTDNNRSAAVISGDNTDVPEVNTGTPATGDKTGSPGTTSPVQKQPSGEDYIQVMEFRELSSSPGSTNTYVGKYNAKGQALRHACLDVFYNGGNNKKSTRKFEYMPPGMDCPFSVELPEDAEMSGYKIGDFKVLDNEKYDCFAVVGSKKVTSKDNKKLIITGRTPARPQDLKNVKILGDFFTEEMEYLGHVEDGSLYLSKDPHAIREGREEFFKIEFDVSQLYQTDVGRIKSVIRMVGEK